ncbi:MAG: IS200/IS605 family transposase, partial [Thermoplasmata archaeon]
MNYELDKGAHSVYTLQYHFIQVVKYRKKIFVDEKLIDFLKQKVKDISESFDVKIIDLECDNAYFHMIFKSKPTLNIPKYI